jgi:hypothetical protein
MSTFSVTSKVCGFEHGTRRMFCGASFGQSRQVPLGESNAAAASSAAVSAVPFTDTGHEKSMLMLSTASAPTKAPAITNRVLSVLLRERDNPTRADIASMMPALRTVGEVESTCGSKVTDGYAPGRDRPEDVA